MVHFSFLMLSFKNLNIFENLNMLKIQDLINNTSKHAEKINLKSINKNNNLRAYIRQCILKKKKKSYLTYVTTFTCETEQLSLPTLMITLKRSKAWTIFLVSSFQKKTSEMNFRQFLMEFPPFLRRIIHNLEKSIIKMNLHKMSVVIKSIHLKKYPSLLYNILILSYI